MSTTSKAGPVRRSFSFRIDVIQKSAPLLQIFAKRSCHTVDIHDLLYCLPQSVDPWLKSASAVTCQGASFGQSSTAVKALSHRMDRRRLSPIPAYRYLDGTFLRAGASVAVLKSRLDQLNSQPIGPRFGDTLVQTASRMTRIIRPSNLQCGRRTTWWSPRVGPQVEYRS